MTTIKIAQDPTFTASVPLPRVGGESTPVEFEFRYLDRLALAELFDRWNAAREALTARASEPGVRWAEITAQEIEFQVDQLQAIVTGWALDDAFDVAALHQLVEACAGAPKAVIEAYQAAYTPARLGN
ncbi:phage tail assembly chaperone [Pseudomonas monteilii]